MKLKEKLAKEYSYRFTDGGWTSEDRRKGFLAGFEAAKKMAIQTMRESPLTLLGVHMLWLGDQEMEAPPSTVDEDPKTS